MIIILVLVQTGDATMSLGQCVCMHFQNRVDESVHVHGGEEVEGRMGGRGDLVHTVHSSQWN